MTRLLHITLEVQDHLNIGGEVGRGVLLGHVLGVVAEVDLLARGVNVGNVLRAEVGQLVDSSNLLDVDGVGRRGDGRHTLLDGPEEEDAGDVGADAGGEALEDGLEGATGLVAQDRGEGAVGLGDDTVLGLQGEEVTLVLGEDVGVELELCEVLVEKVTSAHTHGSQQA